MPGMEKVIGRRREHHTALQIDREKTVELSAMAADQSCGSELNIYQIPTKLLGIIWGQSDRSGRVIRKQYA